MVDADAQRFEPDVAVKIAALGIPVTSTLAVGWYSLQEMMAACSVASNSDNQGLDRWKRILDDNVHQFRAMCELGVSFVAGTDAGWRWTRFDGLAQELSLMQAGGMSAMEAIKAATSRSAEVLGVDQIVGSIRPGMGADIIAVKGNPLLSDSALRRVCFVMKAGKICVPAENSSSPTEQVART